MNKEKQSMMKHFILSQARLLSSFANCLPHSTRAQRAPENREGTSTITIVIGGQKRSYNQSLHSPLPTVWGGLGWGGLAWIVVWGVMFTLLSPIRLYAAPGLQETKPDTSTEQSAAHAEQPATELQRVKVNFFINSIHHVNNESGTYEVDCYLDFYWYDATLAGQRVEEVDPETIWEPKIEPVNATDYQLNLIGYSSSLEPDTNVRASYRLIGQFYNEFKLQKFPFDQQLFTIQLESGDYDSSQMLFDFVGAEQSVDYSNNPVVQSVARDKYLSPELAIQEWTIDDVQVQQLIRVLPYDKSNWSQFRVDIPVTRLWNSYLWRAIIELFLLQVLFCNVLFLDSQNLHYRLLLLFSLFMVTVVLNFVMIFSLPRTPYLTFLDVYVLLGYALGSLLVIVTLAIHLLHQRGNASGAIRLNQLALRFYPVLLLVANALLFWTVLG